MTREELCRDVFKRAFYHAYNNYLLNDERNKTTVCHVKYNRVFFYDSWFPKFSFDPSHNKEYYVSFVINAGTFDSVAHMGKELAARLSNAEDKAAYKKFVDDFNERDMFVDYDIYVESYYFIKQTFRHVWENYVEHIVNQAWLTYTTEKKEDFDREISCMLKAFDDDIKTVWPEQYEKLLDLILDYVNIEYDFSKSFNECRSDIIHVIADSGVLETAAE